MPRVTLSTTSQAVISTTAWGVENSAALYGKVGGGTLELNILEGGER